MSLICTVFKSFVFFCFKDASLAVQVNCRLLSKSSWPIGNEENVHRLNTVSRWDCRVCSQLYSLPESSLYSVLSSSSAGFLSLLNTLRHTFHFPQYNPLCDLYGLKGQWSGFLLSWQIVVPKISPLDQFRAAWSIRNSAAIVSHSKTF